MKPVRLFESLLAKARRACRALLCSALAPSIFTFPASVLTGCPRPCLASCNFADQPRRPPPATTTAWPSSASVSAGARAPSASASETCILQRVFEMLDTDADGYVTADDVARHLGKLELGGDKEAVVEGMAEPAREGAETWDYEGFARVWEGGGEEEEEKEVVEEAFAVFDMDGDGLISEGELQQVLLSLGFTQCHDAAFCRLITTSIAPHLDGAIDLPHFRRMLLS